MADKNIQMTQRNSANTGWDNLNPITIASNVIAADGKTLEAFIATKGKPNGVAELDSKGILPSGSLDNKIDVLYRGNLEGDKLTLEQVDMFKYKSIKVLSENHDFYTLRINGVLIKDFSSLKGRVIISNIDIYSGVVIFNGYNKLLENLSNALSTFEVLSQNTISFGLAAAGGLVTIIGVMK